LSDFDTLRAQIDEMERRQKLAGPRKCASSSFARDEFRCTIHAGFLAVVDHLTLKGWSRSRIAEALDVHPVTLKDWIDSGFGQRNQLPGWVIAAMTTLPPEAWAAFTSRLFSASLATTERTGTGG
jgi:hypothetical protein